MKATVPLSSSPPNAIPYSHLVDLAYDLRSDLLTMANQGKATRTFAWLILDHVGVQLFDFLPDRISPDRQTEIYQLLVSRFLDHVLPNQSTWERLDAKQAKEYLDALNHEPPDPTRLTAAYGAANLGRFQNDSRLVYRCGGYRGRAGHELADDLIALVINRVKNES